MSQNYEPSEVMQNPQALKGKEAHSIIQNALKGNWAEVAEVSKGDIKKELSIFTGDLTTEHRVNYKIGEDTVTGFVDLLYREEREVNIIDLKPGWGEVTAEEELQTSFYVLPELNPFIDCVNTWILRYEPARLLKVMTYTFDDVDRLQVKITRLIDEKRGILDKELYRCKTTPGKSCLYCNFPTTCKEGNIQVNSDIQEVMGELAKIEAKAKAYKQRRDAHIDLAGELISNGKRYFRDLETGKVKSLKA